jgi:hypothetical protein
MSEGKIILAGDRGIRQTSDPERYRPHGDPRLREARPQPITEQTFERSRKFRRMACRHFQNGRARYRPILN